MPLPSTQEPVLTTSQIGIRIGLVTGVVNMLLYSLLFILNQESSQVATFIKYILLVLGIIYSYKLFKDSNHTMSYNQGIGIGVLISIISGLILSIFIYVYQEYIDPEVLLRMADNIRDSLVKAGSVDEAQTEKMISYSMKFSTGYISVLIGTISNLFFGFIISLISSAVMRTKK